jgi:hypothetical protein
VSYYEKILKRKNFGKNANFETSQIKEQHFELVFLACL